jgi:hypothetical protein
MAAFRKFLEECLANSAPLCSHAEPCIEALVKDRRNRVKGRGGGPHR